jgi:hypothetical protein
MTTSPYSDITTFVRDIIQLRNRLIGPNVTKKDNDDYKLLTKVMAAYHRIKNNPLMIIDTISNLDNMPNFATSQTATQSTTQTSTQSTTQTSTQLTTQTSTQAGTTQAVMTERKGSDDSYGPMYLFGNSTVTTEKPKEPESEDERPINELFEYDEETSSDKEDVNKMYQKAKICLDRAISNKHFIAIKYTSDDDKTSTMGTISSSSSDEEYVDVDVGEDADDEQDSNALEEYDPAILENLENDPAIIASRKMKEMFDQQNVQNLGGRHQSVNDDDDDYYYRKPSYGYREAPPPYAYAEYAGYTDLC